jgi:hypothetical protein
VIKVLREAMQNGRSKMTFEQVDKNNSGAIERNEWALLELEDRRRRLDDEDLKRNAERRFTGFALAGMLLYPLIILLSSVLGFDKAASLITDIASVYVIAASGVVAAFMGFNAYSAKADKQASISYQDRSVEK